jgi:hypothetical protein
MAEDCLAEWRLCRHQTEDGASIVPQNEPRHS